MADNRNSEVLDALRQVQDPDLFKDIVTLGFVKDLVIDGGTVSFTINLTTPACPVKEQLEAQAKEVVAALDWVKEVAVKMTADTVHSRLNQDRMLPGVRNIIAVASGKGGVGKSSACASLAVALAQTGATVGVLDADVYGPSQPAMFGLTGAKPEANAEKKLLPIEAHGVRVMSLGFLSSADTPVIWRGPMASKLIEQFLGGVEWGNLDYLLIDLPPGTGDIHLTLTQMVPLTGAVIVTTPQDVAYSIARKGLQMFDQVKVPVLGVIENMSFFACPHCDEKTHIFSGQEGGQKMAKQHEIPLLGEIPLDPAMVLSGDAGEPIVSREPGSASGKAFHEAAGKLAQQLSIINLGMGAAENRPAHIKVDEAGQVLISWQDGANSNLPFRYLRGMCPCALCVSETTGERMVGPEQVPEDVKPVKINPVGRYAISITWSDNHNTGIYAFDYLRSMSGAEAATGASH